MMDHGMQVWNSSRLPCRQLRSPCTCTGELPIGKLEVNGGAVSGGGGEFKCAAVYPTPEQSLRIGRQNLHLFRFKNTRFDVIGGAFYFLMVVSTCSVVVQCGLLIVPIPGFFTCCLPPWLFWHRAVPKRHGGGLPLGIFRLIGIHFSCLQVSVLPRCSRVTDILDAHTLLEAIKYLALAALDALAAIFTESYLSLTAVFCLYLLCWCMAKGGGYVTIPGAPPPPTPGKRESIWEALALRCVCTASCHVAPVL